MTRFMTMMAKSEDTYYALLHGGGKGAPAPLPAVAPTVPVEEASVEIDDEDATNKLKTSKQSLNVPLANTVDTGLKV